MSFTIRWAATSVPFKLVRFAMPMKNAAAVWEAMFDQAVALTKTRRLGETLAKIKRIRSWQCRQTDHSVTNNSWHKAELLYLETIVLDRARHFQRAEATRTRLTKLFLKESKNRGEGWFSPFCQRCALRVTLAQLCANWYSVAVDARKSLASAKGSGDAPPF